MDSGWVQPTLFATSPSPPPFGMYVFFLFLHHHLHFVCVSQSDTMKQVVIERSEMIKAHIHFIAFFTSPDCIVVELCIIEEEDGCEWLLKNPLRFSQTITFSGERNFAVP